MQRDPVWTVYEPMDHPSLGPTCMPTGYSNPAQANWEANFLLNLNCPQPLAAFGRLMANGLWSAVAPQSLELYSLRQGLNMYLAENSMWAIAATGRIMELEGKIGSLEAEVERLQGECKPFTICRYIGIGCRTCIGLGHIKDWRNDQGCTETCPGAEWTFITGLDSWVFKSNLPGGLHPRGRMSRSLLGRASTSGIDMHRPRNVIVHKTEQSGHWGSMQR